METKHGVTEYEKGASPDAGESHAPFLGDLPPWDGARLSPAPGGVAGGSRTAYWWYCRARDAVSVTVERETVGRGGLV